MEGKPRLDISEHVERIAKVLVDEITKARDELMDRVVKPWYDKQNMPEELKVNDMAILERRLTSRLIAGVCATVLNSWAAQLEEELAPRLPMEMTMKLDSLAWLAHHIPLMAHEEVVRAELELGLLPSAGLLVAKMASLKAAGRLLQAMIDADMAAARAYTSGSMSDNSKHYTV